MSKNWSCSHSRSNRDRSLHDFLRGNFFCFLNGLCPSLHCFSAPHSIRFEFTPYMSTVLTVILNRHFMRISGKRVMSLRLCILLGICIFLTSGHYSAQAERVAAFLTCTPPQPIHVPNSYSFVGLKSDFTLQTSFPCRRVRFPLLWPAMSSKGSSDSIKSQQFAARLKLLKVAELRQLLAQVVHTIRHTTP
jgi:hypothetical protein